MELTLAHGIKYAIWHDDWTNSRHDLFLVAVARMLQWQSLFPGRHHPLRPFRNQDLFALLVMGLLPQIVFPVSYNSQGEVVKLPELPERLRHAASMGTQMAKALINGMSREEGEQFESFQADYIRAYIAEFTHRQQSHAPHN